MGVRMMFSGVMTAWLPLTFVLLGCGGVQDEPSRPSRPLEIGVVQSSKQPEPRNEDEPPTATREKVKECIKLRTAEQWAERSYAVQFDAKATDQGKVTEVKIRDTTMPDAEVVECLRQAIATTTIPEHALRKRSVRPFSGGERMMREQRGLVGSESESQNPLVWAFAIVVDEIGVTTLIEVGIGIIAAVGILATPKKPTPKDECTDKYSECMDSPLGNLQMNVRGETVCATCRRRCVEIGAWPSGVKLTHRWQTCN